MRIFARKTLLKCVFLFLRFAIVFSIRILLDKKYKFCGTGLNLWLETAAKNLSFRSDKICFDCVLNIHAYFVGVLANALTIFTSLRLGSCTRKSGKNTQPVQG